MEMDARYIFLVAQPRGEPGGQVVGRTWYTTAKLTIALLATLFGINVFYSWLSRRPKKKFPPGREHINANWEFDRYSECDNKNPPPVKGHVNANSQFDRISENGNKIPLPARGHINANSQLDRISECGKKNPLPVRGHRPVNAKKSHRNSECGNKNRPPAMPTLCQTVWSHRPNTWEYMPDDSDEVKCFTLNASSAEYLDVSSKLCGITPTRIVRVQNPMLWGFYLLKKDEYIFRHGRVLEKDLWHATAARKVESIIRTNLDWRLTKRNLYGKGVSFSADPHYANKYCNLKNGCSRALLLCKVLVGKKCIGFPSMVVPHTKYDSSVSRSGKVIVKYMDNEFYPEYVVYYQMKGTVQTLQLACVTHL